MEADRPREIAVPERELFSYLVRRVVSGFRPRLAEVSARTAARAGEDSEAAFQGLVAKGWIRLDPLAGDLSGVGPFAFEDTDWSVSMGETAVSAQSALDSLAVHFVSGNDVFIRSHCGYCSREITITIKYGRIRSAAPAEIRVFLPEEADPPVPSLFFCCPSDFFSWRSENPRAGTALTLEEGLIYSEGFFGGAGEEGNVS